LKHRQKKKRFFCWMISCLIAINLLTTTPVMAQIPFLQDFLFQSQELENSLIKKKSNNVLVSECIRLDGNCLFKIASLQPELSERIAHIQTQLDEISQLYLDQELETVRVAKQRKGNLIDLYVIIGEESNDDGIRLLTVNSNDANLEGVSIDTRADQLSEALKTGLRKAKKEREGKFLERQILIAVSVLFLVSLSSWVIQRWRKISETIKKQLAPSEEEKYLPISKQLNQRQQWNLKEVQLRLLQLTQITIWGGGIVFILGLFPQTRFIQFWIISSLRIPIRILIVLLVNYLLIRISYALIARFNSAFIVSTYLINRQEHRRLQLRVTTITKISKSIVTIVWITFGIVIILSIVGVDIAPLLAGAGIVGVALSLASQNLIKDAINGFFIILEDQYAVGDVINVGNVSGLVENINLRITQLRDGEGRLITIPNSEIKIVANLSSQWSRADLNIPIAYDVDIDKAMKLIAQVAEKMSEESDWRDHILEAPQVLGVENFGDRGITVKVWIKTEPLKQWDVSREFRRRIKIACDSAGIPIPIPQQQIWVDRQNR
jgi:moderate conductance mechanosensitive channel